MRRARARRPAIRGWRILIPKGGWRLFLLIVVGVPTIAASAFLGYYYVEFSRIIEARLHGERDRVVPRVFARPVTLHSGQEMSAVEIVARLNDLGYTERARAERPGEFAVESHAITIRPRGGDQRGKSVRVTFPEPRTPKGPTRPVRGLADRIHEISVENRSVDEVILDAPMLTALVTGSREKRRRVPLESIPTRVRQAVLAIEDRRFYGHPGLDPISLAGAVWTNLTSDRRYPIGRSTITQQLARMFFLSEEFNAELQSKTRGRSLSSYRRKVLEMFMALILETQATKDEVLELYLNDIYLGNRGSFAIHGVPEAARIYFGKDVTNLSLSEAAMIAGAIQNPSLHSPFGSLERARERRNTVLRAMAEANHITAEAAERASHDPIAVLARAVDNEAPYFVDYVSEELQRNFPGMTQRTGALDVYATLDLNLQRYAQDAVRHGMARVDETLARRRRVRRDRAQAALVALDPRTGDILALVGGRSYNQSQFNRAIAARRQPGSTFKPFVYLAAFERAAEEARADLTPATLVWDEPTTWLFDEQEWSPRNYEDEYDGQVTLRRALALSRNIATIKVAEQVGFDQVATLWKRTGIGKTLQGYPSIALGVFELTPLEVATAYTLFANGGSIRPLRAVVRVASGSESFVPDEAAGPAVAAPTTTFLVTNMMRSVINEGTGASARGNGFTFDAAGKSGTTNDLRDAWFVGFTPELLAVVWVGFDDNTPLGLSGTQAALPIWTDFMRRALAGHGNRTFDPPDGISFVEIDRDTGHIALPTCPRATTEAFLAGTEPLEMCGLHRW